LLIRSYTILSNLQDVVVAPTSAILKYAAQTEPAQVCRDLGVRHSLQGTVQRLGSQLARLDAALRCDDPQGHSLESHDFDLDNVFDVQDEIGRRIMTSLQSRFSPAIPKSRDRYSSDPEAYGEFMLGLRESASDRLEVLQSAATHLSAAVERDPEFALAHAWLAHVAMQIDFSFDADRRWLDKAEQHCHRALSWIPNVPRRYWASVRDPLEPGKELSARRGDRRIGTSVGRAPKF
jgi:hypothetical protein